MKIFTILFFALFHINTGISLAQWSDDFSYDSLDDNPLWRGDVNHFTIEDGWLRLNAPAVPATSFLSIVSDVAVDASWEFVFRMNFTPSAANYARVYLISDRPALNSQLVNGYYLRLGGDTNRNITLFKQNGAIIERLIQSRDGILDAPSNQIRVRVTRDMEGNWTLETNQTEGFNFQFEGRAQSRAQNISEYFGIVCTYTATRSAGFFFSDFKVNGQPYVDVEPPTVTSWIIEDNNVNIHFSKSISEILQPFESYFALDERINLVNVQSIENSIISLHFSTPIECGIRHRLTIRKLEDIQGNVMRDTTIFISAPCIAEPFDIVINEIMADPSPSVRLPEYEYIELYNRSNKNIDIDGWTFSYGNVNRTIPQYLFPAGGYLLLVHPTAESALSAYGTALPVLGSLTAIANAGQYLQLRDNQGNLISWVDFNSDWYREPLKSNGGWALEQINPDLICSVQTNWIASNAVNGGTPGQQNSVHGSVSNISSPEIIRIATPNNNTILLYVSNPIKNIPPPDISKFEITPKVEHVEITGQHFDKLELRLQEPLLQGNWYDLRITDNIVDCAGKKTALKSFYFTMPQYVDSFDIVINEILFNPVVGGYSFIELFNRSQKAIQANDLQISLRNNNGALSTPVQLTDEPFLILPGQYLVISRNVEAVMQQYIANNYLSAFLQMRNMPNLTRTSGHVVLLNKSLQIIDEVRYNSNQHTDFLNSGNGVSLERVNPNRPSFEAGNWHTAGQIAGFATPGRQNSQYMEILEIASPNEVNVNPEVFSPYNSGVNDLTSINYRFDIPSLTGNVIIFDSAGRTIRTIASQQLLATEGSFIWDGSDDRGRKVLPGVYIVFFQAYNAQGVKKQFKIPCVVAGIR